MTPLPPLHILPASRMMSTEPASRPYAEICRFGQAQRLDDSEEDPRATMLRALKGLFHDRFREFGLKAGQIPFCKLAGFGWNALYWLRTIAAAL